MMVLLYSMGIRFYAVVLRILAGANNKAKQWTEGQAAVFAGLQQAGLHDVTWFHCASVGEFEQGLPLYEKLRDADSSRKFLFTFFSPSGYRYVAARHPGLAIAYLPLDTKANVQRFLDLVKPKAAFFIKYEFWFHYLTAIHARGIPVYLVSGIFRPSQPFFQWYGWLHRKMLACFTHFFVQDENSVSLLRGIGITRATCCGDTRYDRVLALSQQPFTDDKILAFAGSSPVFVAGSVWKEDIPVLRQILATLPAGWKIILAPHEFDHFPSEQFGSEMVRYSAYSAGHPARILLVDQLGLLSRLYRMAQFAYIGGGYGKGIHNILEAAVYGIPVLFGPRHQKFREAAVLRSEGLAFETAEAGFQAILEQIVHDATFRQVVRERSGQFMARNAHVSEKIMTLLNAMPGPL